MRDAASMQLRGGQVGVQVAVACALACVASGCGDAGDDGGSVGGGVVAQASAADAAGGDAAARPSGIVVDVAGMVRTPGVYELPRGARVHDAIAAAGGVRPGGVLTSLNRAAEVVDGQQVTVPDGRAAASTERLGGASPGAGAGPAGGGTVSLNAADAAAFDALPGIGPVTARRIVDDRTANGPFADVADLDRVPGIGAGTIADLESLVTP